MSRFARALLAVLTIVVLALTAFDVVLVRKFNAESDLAAADNFSCRYPYVVNAQCIGHAGFQAESSLRWHEHFQAKREAENAARLTGLEARLRRLERVTPAEAIADWARDQGGKP